MSGVKVSLALQREFITTPEDGQGGRLTSGRIGGVTFFASSSSQSIPSNHDIFLISERPAIPSLQHNRASLSLSTNLGSKHEGTRKTKEAVIHSPLSKLRCTQDCTFPSDRGRTQGPPPSQCWTSVPDHFARCTVGPRKTPRTT